MYSFISIIIIYLGGLICINVNKKKLIRLDVVNKKNYSQYIINEKFGIRKA